MRPQNQFVQGRGEKPAPPPYQHSRYALAMYREDGAQVIAHDEEEEQRFAELGFSDKMPELQATRTETPVAGQTAALSPAPGCAHCHKLTIEKADMEGRFNKAWEARLEELDSLKSQLEGLSAERDQLAEEARKREEHVSSLQSKIDTLQKQAEALTTELEKSAASKKNKAQA